MSASPGRLVVTGGRGLLGNAVIRAAVDDGWDVVAFQRGPSGMAGAGTVVDVLGSVVDASAVRRAIDGADAVIHLAARVGIDGSWADFEAVNVAGTDNVLDAARRAGVRAFVHVSSPSVAHVGEPLVGARAEVADPVRARGHYSRSKATAELHVLRADDSMPVVAIRPHLVWGPGDTQLVGRIVERARAGRLFLIDQGRALIDTTYIDNAAQALVRAVSRIDYMRGRAYVVSNGEPRPVRDVISAIVHAAGIDAPVRSIPRGPAWVAGVAGEFWGNTTGSEPVLTRFLVEQLATAHWFDVSATWSALNWRPSVGFDEGIGELAAWFRRA